MKTELNPKQSDADRFKEFTRKLVNVPKSEIDKKAEEFHRQRIAERKRAAKSKPKTS